MKYIIYLSLLISLVSCKKDCPAPLPGNTIYQDIPSKYSGLFSIKMFKEHSTFFNLSSYPDSVIDISISTYNDKTNYLGSEYDFSPVSSVSVTNTPNLSLGSSDYSTNLLSASDVYPYSFLGYFKSIHYYIDSPKYGVISLDDIRPEPTFTNQNSIPLNFSISNSYTLSLNGLTNCNYALLFLGDELYRKILPSNPVTKFYASELNYANVGDTLGLTIQLYNEKDSLISGNIFKLRKVMSHDYHVICIP